MAMLASLAAVEKSPEAFRTISEVALELDMPQHVLRFWESRFAQVRPIKRAGGRRYYRPEDVDLLRGIRTLLYREGFTIKGVQKILRDRGQRHVAELGRGEAPEIVPVVSVVPSVRPPPERSNVIALERAPEAPTFLLAEEERVQLEILLAELQQLKARLRGASPVRGA